MPSLLTNMLILSDGKQLLIVDGGRVWQVDDPCLESVSFQMERPPPICIDDFGVLLHTSPSRIRVDIRLIAQAGQQYEAADMRHFRFADDMTVRELLSTVNRKIERRQP